MTQPTVEQTIEKLDALSSHLLGLDSASGEGLLLRDAAALLRQSTQAEALKETALVITVLDLLRVLEDLDAKYNALNKQISDLQGDFPQLLQYVDPTLGAKMFELLDHILDDEQLASYYFYEARNMKGGGKIVEKDGREWPIRNIADLKAYLDGKRGD